MAMETSHLRGYAKGIGSHDLESSNFNALPTKSPGFGAIANQVPIQSSMPEPLFCPGGGNTT